MPYPRYPDKHAEEALVRPEIFLEFIRRSGRYPAFAVPEAVVLCYQASLVEHIREHHAVTMGDGYLAKMMLPAAAGGRVGVVGGFGIGAPIAAAFLEELIAFGVRRVVSIGSAGSLQPGLGIGDLVVCERAIRDEGVSHHYLPAGVYAQPSERLTQALADALQEGERTCRRGTTWTIDAPYRETVAEVRHYQSEGVCTVEMEAAALFAVATRRGIDLAAGFAVSDSLAGLAWEPHFGSAATRAGLESLYGAALRALAEDLPEPREALPDA